MKRLILTLGLVLIFFTGKAQQQVEYDTIIYHSPELTDCSMLFDTMSAYEYGHGLAYFHRLRQLRCHSIYDKDSNFLGVLNYMILGTPPISEYTAYNPEGFAQPYHFDSVVLVCGMAARVHGLHPNGEWVNYKFHLMDTNFNDLASCYIMFTDTVMWGPQYWQCPFGNFYFDDIVPIKDFYLTADICTNGGTIGYNQTYSIFDTTECLDTILGCQATYSPYIKKDGQWKSFAEDTVYQIWQKTFIEWLPILLVPKSDTINTLTQIHLDKTVSIYPNPAKNELFVQSNFKVKTIEIYNALGVKVREDELNKHEATIDIHNLPSGSYTIKLQTTQGSVKKKFVVE